MNVDGVRNWIHNHFRFNTDIYETSDIITNLEYIFKKSFSVWFNYEKYQIVACSNH